MVSSRKLLFQFDILFVQTHSVNWMPPANSHVSISLLKVYEVNPIASRRAIWFAPRFGSEIFVREALYCRYSRCVILDLGEFIGSIRRVRSTFLQFFLQLSSPNFRLAPRHGRALIPNRYPHELQTMPSTTPKIATRAMSRTGHLQQSRHNVRLILVHLYLDNIDYFPKIMPDNLRLHRVPWVSPHLQRYSFPLVSHFVLMLTISNSINVLYHVILYRCRQWSISQS